MNKAELIAYLQERMQITHNRAVSKADVEALLESLGYVSQEVLVNNHFLTLPGIGKLSTTVRAARTGRNPQTGAAIEIPAAKVVRFKALKSLKDALN